MTFIAAPAVEVCSGGVVDMMMCVFMHMADTVAVHNGTLADAVHNGFMMGMKMYEEHWHGSTAWAMVAIWGAWRMAGLGFRRLMGGGGVWYYMRQDRDGYWYYMDYWGYWRRC